MGFTPLFTVWRKRERRARPSQTRYLSGSLVAAATSTQELLLFTQRLLGAC